MAWFKIYKQTALVNIKSNTDSWLARVIYRETAEAGAKNLSNILAFVGSLLLAYSFWRITKELEFPGKWAVIPVTGAVFIIFAGPKAWINRKVLSNKLIVWFGLISFPLYLWHWPLLSFARIIEGEVPSYNVRVAAIAISIVLAWFTYKFFEQPVRLGKGGRATVTVLIVVMAVVFTVGYRIYVNDGYDSRESIRTLVNNKNELVRTPASDEACLSYVKPEVPLFPYCRFKDVKSDETVAVIGDSHAHVSYQGISEFLSTYGKNTVLLANSGCPPFLGSPTGNNPAEVAACADRIEQLLTVVESKKEIHKVFVFTRGPIYTSNTEPLTGDKKLGATIIPLEKFIKSAQISFNRLTSKGKSVFYISENPELNFHPDSCLTRPFKVRTEKCTIQKQAVNARQDDYRRGFSGLKNITYIDSLPFFCPADQCLIFDEKGALLYADDDHLSIAGSRFQAKHILLPYLN